MWRINAKRRRKSAIPNRKRPSNDRRRLFRKRIQNQTSFPGHALFDGWKSEIRKCLNISHLSS